MTIRRFNRDTPTYPERTVFTSRRVFNDHNGFFEFGFKCLAALSVPDDKTPGWTISCFFDCNVPGFRIT
jgi:hypothetical protein